ncbi:hypothetical protein [Mucilaginibacter lappiensis]|uniref:Cytochrome P460 n=1 Tax=Mucilaginibacter lappiensis TaxID=354630 RepID=A0A841JAC8_9SPHI|nr:hypothetical protein [Mucilaginibacter lappiensis]MBB6127740.1 hypothetical protein [Mucilaginibacter lappiensis]
MKITYILFAASVFVLSACNNRKPSEELLNKKAAIPASFNFSKAGLKVITSSINKKEQTMSTLYGNDLALKTAISGTTSYPPGENLTLVTWSQQDDDRWFGAKIPADLLSVEVVKIISSNTGSITTIYQRFTGKKLIKDTDTAHQQERINYIFSQKPSVMP